MKRIFWLIFTLILFKITIASENEEFRATWVVTWELIKPYTNPAVNKALAQKILDDHKKANMNAVLWHCRQSGTAYYESEYEPWGYYAGYQYPGYDPLAYAIEEAHQRGLELHAWFNVFHCSNTRPGTPAGDHPEWVCTDENGVFMTVNENGNSIRCLSPGLAAVRKYLVNVAMEVVRNYDIDGIHFDFIRWNEYTYHPAENTNILSLNSRPENNRQLDGMITAEQIEALHRKQSLRYIYDVEHPFRAGVPAGFDNWDDWRRWCVTEFVRTFHDSLKQVKPWVRISVAALGKYNWDPGGWDGYHVVFQDAARWFNEGYVDQLTPMHYHWTRGEDFYDMLTGGCPKCWGQFIQPGINAGRLYTVGPGSYIFDEYNVWERHPEVIQACRTVPWVDGFQFFRYQQWENYHYWEVARSTFFNRKTKIRAINLVEVPPVPSIELTKIDSLNYQIQVQIPQTIEKDHWFLVYRSTDENPDVDQDEIVDCRFGQIDFSSQDSFTGDQDYDGEYHYFATTLNRYWNESPPSNALTSDPIPSFAPRVIATSPAAGVLVSMNSAIVIHFSKMMDILSFENAVHFNPTVPIAQLVWSEDHRSVTIEPAVYFDLDTEYSLTIDATVKDVNGKALDGNGDRIPGDAFVFHFKTKIEDDVPPRVIASYPDFTTQNDSLDVQDVLTFVIDEIIDENSLNTNSVALYRSSTKIPAQYLHTVFNKKSIIDLQPEQPLETETDYTGLLLNTITDKSGNALTSHFYVSFRTSAERYTEIKIYDDFATRGEWWQPDGSGSTTGIIVEKTRWSYVTDYYLPATTTPKAAMLQYAWNTADSTFLLRQHLPPSDPKHQVFDTTYVLQCYIYGDASHNLFRFCIDEGDGSNWTGHEVSEWITIDWSGWRLVEWDLRDPARVGDWLSEDNLLNGAAYRFDSFQLTHPEGAAATGVIYFDDFRLAKKSSAPVTAANQSAWSVPLAFKLYQNYPNPFNATTTIAFDLPEAGLVRLDIHDLLGREVTQIINQPMAAGSNQVKFDATNLSSGLYFYSLKCGKQEIVKQMLLMK